MTRDDIIKMAREAGAMFDHMTWVERDLAPVFERFAALVLANHPPQSSMAWQEGYEAGAAALMQLFTDPENQPTQHGTVTVEYMQREIQAEREACALIAETPVSGEQDDITMEAKDRVAAAIRARGQE